MSEFENDPTPEPTPDPAPTPDPVPAPDPAPTADYVPREEFENVQRALQQQQAVLERFLPRPVEPEIDPDVEALVAPIVQRYIAPYQPAYEASLKQEGERRMNTLFDEVQKSENIDFDRELARRVAQGALAEIGDPVEATKFGAKYAAEVRKAERAAGQEEYKKSLKRPVADEPPVRDAGLPLPPAGKDESYDDVINRWAGFGGSNDDV